MLACGLASSGLTGLGALPGCAAPRSIGAPSKPIARYPGRPPVTVWSWFDLPDDRRSRELSAAVWEARTNTLWCIQDDTALIVGLRPDDDLKRWSFVAAIQPSIQGELDAEGLVVLEDSFVLCSEVGPRILQVDREGKFVRDVALPSKFAEAVINKSFESLTLSPDGRYLYTTSETSLPRDASVDPADPRTARDFGATVRILRLDRFTGATVERAYATDRVPACADYGVAEITAIGGEDLLVLERGWAKGQGNEARIYRVDFADMKADCQAIERLGPEALVLDKALFVDLMKLDVAGLPSPRQVQPSPLMDNFEGMGLGPALPDGRPTVILVSDDNARSDQVARVVVLAVG